MFVGEYKLNIVVENFYCNFQKPLKQYTYFNFELISLFQLWFAKRKNFFIISGVYLYSFYLIVKRFCKTDIADTKKGSFCELIFFYLRPSNNCCNISCLTLQLAHRSQWQAYQRTKNSLYWRAECRRRHNFILLIFLRKSRTFFINKHRFFNLA